ncbi:MAG: AMP-binding protein [Pseudomonadota bacterium]|nr:AMP-binding protein [Pseudomonadota bacterium]
MHSTVHACFLEAVAEAPDNAFLACPPDAGRAWHPDGKEYTYAEAARAVAALIALYDAAGYGVGHRVAVLMENRPEHFFHVLALNALGASCVPVNPDYTHDEALYQMEHSEADLCVATRARVGFMEDVAKARPSKPMPVVCAEDLPASLPRPTFPKTDAVPDLETEVGLYYTSGTTGRPKGCIVTNFYYLNGGAWYRNFGGTFAMETGRERVYNPLPVFHMNCGIVAFVCMILGRNCLVIPDRFHPGHWWKDLVEMRVTGFHYLGIVAPVLLKQPPCPEEKQHMARFALGAGMEPELHPVFEERFGVRLTEVWGMTETGRIFADAFEPRQITTRAFGRPIGGLEAKIVDDDDTELPRGTPGELLVRWGGEEGPRHGFFSGYLKNEKATEDSWKGGWFHTGDIVMQDGTGMLFFVDRKKNIIRRSGENIAAAEIEATIQAMDEVAQVAVIAAPDELRDEEVMACIVPMAGVETGPALAEAIQARCLEKLAYYKAPGWIAFIEKLPTTGTQKVQKQEIFPKGSDPRQAPGVIDLRAAKKKRR